ncbi:MAG: hypothetical protein ACRDBY_14055 [Cetobacterium sp.]
MLNSETNIQALKDTKEGVRTFFHKFNCGSTNCEDCKVIDVCNSLEVSLKALKILLKEIE